MLFDNLSRRREAALGSSMAHLRTIATLAADFRVMPFDFPAPR